MTLNEIIIDKNDNSIKLSKTKNPNWRKLVDLCEYGFTITDDITKIEVQLSHPGQMTSLNRGTKVAPPF